MASLNKPLSTEGIDTNSTYDLIPEDWYQAVIKESDEGENKKGTGRYIQLVFTIGSGKYAGKEVKKWYNYVHSTAKAQEIAVRELAKVMECLNVPSPLKDTAQLHSKPILIHVVQDGTYNTVDDCKPYGSVNQQAATQNATKELYGKPAEEQTGFSDLEPEWARG